MVLFFVFGFVLMVLAPQRMKGLESASRAQPVVSGVGAIFRVAGARSFEYDAEWRLVGPTACPAGQPLRAGGVSGVAPPTGP